jgi:hypothetical protein
MTFKASNDLEDFVGKIDWEGGIPSAMEYGLESKDYDLPDDVAEKWDDMQAHFSEFETLEGEFWAMVKAHGVEY